MSSYPIPFIDPNRNYDADPSAPGAQALPVAAAPVAASQPIPTIAPPPGQIPSIRQYQPNQQRQQRESSLRSALMSQENPTPPSGFWGKAGHILQTIGSVAGNAILGPATTSLIPGTEQYKSAQHSATANRLSQLEGQDAKDEDDFNTNQLKSAQTQEATAKAQSLANPPDKADKFTYQQTDHGLMRIDSTTGEATPVTYNGQPLQPFQKDQKDEAPTIQLQRQIQDAESKGETATAKKLQGQLKDLNPMAEQRFSFQVGEAGARDAKTGEKGDTATRAAAFKAYTPAMDSAERFNVMAKNYEDAVKNHDQQAMLSLLANHLGMTMGLQKGARMTKDIVHEAQESRPWLQGMQAKFDNNGYLSGVTLSPEQMRQMVDLGRERFGEDVTKARNEAHYLGANDEGPERTPNKSAINHYLGLAGGDPAKAKALAAQDGWTVK